MVNQKQEICVGSDPIKVNPRNIKSKKYQLSSFLIALYRNSGNGFFTFQIQFPTTLFN